MSKQSGEYFWQAGKSFNNTFSSVHISSINRFNRVFQKFTEKTTSQLYTETSRLTRLYASNILQRSAITSAGDDLKKLKLDTVFQLPDENLGVGTDTWTCLSELQEEYDLKPFFCCWWVLYSYTEKDVAKISFWRFFTEGFNQMWLQHSQRMLLLA